MTVGFKTFDVVHGDVAALSHGSGGFDFNAETRLVRYVSAANFNPSGAGSP